MQQVEISIEITGNTENNTQHYLFVFHLKNNDDVKQHCTEITCVKGSKEHKALIDLETRCTGKVYPISGARLLWADLQEIQAAKDAQVFRDYMKEALALW